jgi:CHAP domain-containing protein
MLAAERRVVAVARARVRTQIKTRYALGAGGRNPATSSPCTLHNGLLGCDCIGFVCWCLQTDRYRPKDFGEYDGWMNTDSIISNTRSLFDPLWKVVAIPEPGDVVVYPGRTENGKRVAIGHVGLVTKVPPEHWPDMHVLSSKGRAAFLSRVEVIDCNASLRRRLSGYAIGENAVHPTWNRPDAKYLRFHHPDDSE